MHRRFVSFPRFRANSLLLVGVALALVLGLASPSFAQEDDAVVAFGLTVWKDKGACPQCHGWAANGAKLDQEAPDSPSLRASLLDRDTLIEVVQCGRPGTSMPYHDKRAYTDNRCYGLTHADLDLQTKAYKGVSLNDRQIEAVAAYLLARIIGRAEITLEECIEYYGQATHRRCRRFQ